MNPMILLAIGAAILVAIGGRSEASENPSCLKDNFRSGYKHLSEWKRIIASLNLCTDILCVDDYLTIVQIESNGCIDALGDGGKSFGLMQVQKGAFMDVKRATGLKYKYETLKGDAEKQLYVGCWYLRLMTEQFGSLKEGVQAYNVGPGNLYSSDMFWVARRETYWGHFTKHKSGIMDSEV